jgi:hypothetical protein
MNRAILAIHTLRAMGAFRESRTPYTVTPPTYVRNEEARRFDDRKWRIVRTLLDANGPRTSRQIAAYLRVLLPGQFSVGGVNQYLVRARAEGLVEGGAGKRGVWTLTEKGRAMAMPAKAEVSKQ